MVKRGSMGIQVFFRVAAMVLFLCTAASGAEHRLCFDFNKKVTKPLRAPIEFGGVGADGAAPADVSETGKREDGGNWAAVRGVVSGKSIDQVLALVLDHNNLKSSEVDEMQVVEHTGGSTPMYLARHDVKYLIKPFPFIKIRWTEQWAYALTGGLEKDPSEVVISYQKSEGTSYIEHLCGTLILRKNGPHSTDLYQYEEAKAARRSVDETLNGLVGTLRTLRK